MLLITLAQEGILGVLKSTNVVYKVFKSLSIYEFATWGRYGVNSMEEGVSMHNTHLFGLGIRHGLLGHILVEVF